MKRRSRLGWLELILGVLLILLGDATILLPGKVFGGLIVLFGFAAVIMGIGDILLYIRMERFIGFGPVISLISGIVSVMAGIMLVVYPGAGVMVLSVLFPIWFIAHCISRLSHAGTIRLFSGNGMYYTTLILNGVGLALGILMLFRPAFSLAAIGFIAGFYLILLGTDSIILACSNVGMR